MNEQTQAKGKSFAKFIASLSQSDITNGNQIQRQQVEEEYKEFLEQFKKVIVIFAMSLLRAPLKIRFNPIIFNVISFSYKISQHHHHP